MHIDECIYDNIEIEFKAGNYDKFGKLISSVMVNHLKLKEYLIEQNDRILLLEDVVKKMGAENAHYQRALKEIGL